MIRCLQLLRVTKTDLMADKKYTMDSIKRTNEFCYWMEVIEIRAIYYRGRRLN